MNSPELTLTLTNVRSDRFPGPHVCARDGNDILSVSIQSDGSKPRSDQRKSSGPKCKNLGTTSRIIIHVSSQSKSNNDESNIQISMFQHGNSNYSKFMFELNSIQFQIQVHIKIQIRIRIQSQAQVNSRPTFKTQSTTTSKSKFNPN